MRDYVRDNVIEPGRLFVLAARVKWAERLLDKHRPNAIFVDGVLNKREVMKAKAETVGKRLKAFEQTQAAKLAEMGKIREDVGNGAERVGDRHLLDEHDRVRDRYRAGHGRQRTGDGQQDQRQERGVTGAYYQQK